MSTRRKISRKTVLFSFFTGSIILLTCDNTVFTDLSWNSKNRIQVGYNRTSRRTSVSFPGGSCEVTVAKEPDPPIMPIFTASYPGSGAKMTWNLIEALTGLWTGDEWFINGREKNVVSIKTHYPQSNGRVIPYDSEITRALILIRHPLDAIPSYHNYIYETENGLTPHTTRAPIEEWIPWRDRNFEVELKVWERSIRYWMDKYLDLNRLLVSYEDLVDDDEGPKAMGRIGDFLERTPGVKVVDRESLPCVWRAVIRYHVSAGDPNNVNMNNSTSAYAMETSSAGDGGGLRNRRRMLQDSSLYSSNGGVQEVGTMAHQNAAPLAETQSAISALYPPHDIDTKQAPLSATTPEALASNFVAVDENTQMNVPSESANKEYPATSFIQNSESFASPSSPIMAENSDMNFPNQQVAVEVPNSPSFTQTPGSLGQASSPNIAQNSDMAFSNQQVFVDVPNPASFIQTPGSLEQASSPTIAQNSDMNFSNQQVAVEVPNSASFIQTPGSLEQGSSPIITENNGMNVPNQQVAVEVPNSASFIQTPESLVQASSPIISDSLNINNQNQAVGGEVSASSFNERTETQILPSSSINTESSNLYTPSQPVSAENPEILPIINMEDQGFVDSNGTPAQSQNSDVEQEKVNYANNDPSQPMSYRVGPQHKPYTLEQHGQMLKVLRELKDQYRNDSSGIAQLLDVYIDRVLHSHFLDENIYTNLA